MMNEYSISQLQSMQRQAQRRVEEMNARARRALEKSAPSTKNEQTVKKGPENNSFPANLLQSLNLQSLLGGNSDQTLLVLVLILLLSDGNCDEMLILAILYLIF